MATGNAIQSPFGGASSSSGTATLALEANALVDTTGTVNVSSSAAPSAGQVLIASSANTATWGAQSGGGSGTSTVTNALADATGTVNVSNASAPAAAGSVLTSSDTTDAIWSTTTGTVGSAGLAGFATNAGTATVAGFATNAGTATIAGFATNAGTATVSGTATIANALNASGGTVNVAGQAAPGAAGSVLTVTQVSAGGTLGSWSTTAGTVGSASVTTNAGTATVSGTATIANALNASGGTVNVSAATAPGASGSVLVASSATTAVWTTTIGTVGFATNLSDGTTVPAYLAPNVVTLTMAATIAVNAALGNDYRLTLTSSTATMGNPSNPIDGQTIKFQFTQDTTGTRTIAAWGTSYDFGAAGTPVLSTATSTIDIIGMVYNAAKTKWLGVGTVLGF